MYSIEPFELGMACIVFLLYIVGKVWMYYRIEDPTKNPKRIKSGRKSRTIKRGPEWPE